jgi:hypothetical protein
MQHGSIVLLEPSLTPRLFFTQTLGCLRSSVEGVIGFVKKLHSDFMGSHFAERSMEQLKRLPGVAWPRA